MLVGLDPTAARAEYRRAEPWPHLVLDDVISRDTAAAIVAETEQMPSGSMLDQRTRRQQKLSSTDPSALGPVTSEMLRQLNGPGMAGFIEAVTGISGLLADPEFSRAGLFVTPPGGWQRIHEDFRRHPDSGLWNRVITLLYCTEWSPSWGGELEMWPLDMAEVGKRVEPRPGRMVLFEATRSHRHGIRVIAPGANPRVALANRWYSAGPPPETPSPPLLTWSRRPNERRRDVVPTVSEVLQELKARARRRTTRH